MSASYSARMGDDAQLVDDFIAGRSSGLARAYECFARDLVAAARHVVGEARAEDCVHDALVRVWRTPGAYRRERGSLRGFLIACVRNEAMSALRRDARRGAREERARRLEEPLALAAEPADPIDAARVRTALDRLPPEQRVALEHAYLGNRSHTEIAAALALPLGTVKSRIALGMRKLAAELAEPVG